MVLEVYAPVYEASQTDEADGLVACDWCVDDITKRCAHLSAEGRNFENAYFSNGLCDAAYAAKAYRRHFVITTLLDV